MFCRDEACDTSIELKVDNKLILELEPENEHDKNAVKILDCRKNLIGNVPRYYSESVADFLNKGASYECSVIEVNKQGDCRECIKVQLKILQIMEQIVNY